MSMVHARIEIAAAPGEVFATIMDPARLSEWVTIHRSVSNVAGEPDCAGARMDQVLTMRGVNFKVHWTLTEVSAPRHAVWEGSGPAMSRALIRYELHGSDGGPTTFDYSNEFRTPGGRLGALASQVVVGSAAQREAQQSLRRLKTLIEQR
jgi:carbon monoxide dehydrogenase subunit G